LYSWFFLNYDRESTATKPFPKPIGETYREPYGAHDQPADLLIRDRHTNTSPTVDIEMGQNPA
jgi:hypothetical protein